MAQANMTASGDKLKNPLFDQALQKHLESLRTEDRDAFERCSAEDVIAAVQQLDSSHIAQSRTRQFLVRFAAIIRPLESYFNLVSNVVGSIPGGQLGAIVFGALSFVVKVWSCYAFSLRNCSLYALPTQTIRPSTDYRTTSSELWESWRRYPSLSLFTKIMLLRSIVILFPYSKYVHPSRCFMWHVKTDLTYSL